MLSTALPSAVTLMEVSPRDGLQNEAAELTTAQKLELIDRALQSGVKRIEVTSFVHPGKVPRMADAEAVCAGLPQRGDVRYTGLILNQRGYERLLATEKLDEAGFVIPVSDTFGQRNQGQSAMEATESAAAVLKDARSRGFAAQATLAVAFGCPFEGDVPRQRVIDIAKRLADEAPVEIGLADTIVLVCQSRSQICLANCATSLDRTFLYVHTFMTQETQASPMRAQHWNRV